MVNATEVFSLEAEPDDRKLKEFTQHVRDKIRANMTHESNRLMGLMKARTPYQTGRARNSGHVSGPMDEGNDIIMMLSFGGSEAPHAIYVHERVNLRHRHGRAKFMESVVQEEQGNIGPNLAKGL